MKTIRFIDLFAGIGGFRYGFEKVENKRLAGESIATRRYKPINNSRLGKDKNKWFVCVYSNEWDKYASQVYKKHFGECDTRDIRTVNDVPDHDLLVGGFPCQAFSIAGKRRGFDDTRGTLFFEIARILKEKRPRLCLLENVKGLLSHDNGRTFKTIISTLVELGYDIQWQVLNSKNFGVPQNRERVFIIGHLRGTPRPKVFPIGKGGRENVSPQWKEDKPKAVMLAEHRTELGKQTRREIRQREGRDSTLRGKEHKEYRPNMNGVANCITTGKENVEKWLIDLSMKQPKLTREARALQARYWKGYSNRTAETSGVYDGIKIRRLTPTECERLQGFPDGWTEGISDTQRYKCLGNAVTTNVISFIGARLNENS